MRDIYTTRGVDYDSSINWGECKQLLRKGFKVTVQPMAEGVDILVQKTDYIKQYKHVNNDSLMLDYDGNVGSITIDYDFRIINHPYGVEWANKSEY
ncbi:MAG: hypothetical protein NZ824_10660 [Candidatus Thioglobus sp.]|nr:hypothetical protein [Candidatus Thioglobus sp.]